MLYQEYDPAILKRLQKTECEILFDFDSFCREHDIDYFGCYGTAIGAIRHGGFVPWDDDIDIGMTRENYDRFVELSHLLPDKYKFISRYNTDNFPMMTAWIILKGTKFRVLKEPDIENGVYLDLYCFDHIYDDDRKMKKQMISGWLWGKLLVLWYIKEPTIYFKGYKAKLIHACCNIAHHLLRLVCRDPQFLYDKAYKHATELKGVKTKRVAYMFDPTPFTSIIAMSDLEPTREYEFEGRKIKFPANADNYLRLRYGDYMMLPPEKDRHNHPPYELELPAE